MVTAVKDKLTDQTQPSVCTNKFTPTLAVTKAFFFFMLLQICNLWLKKSSEQQNAWQNETNFKNSATRVHRHSLSIACPPLLAEIKKKNTCLSCVWILDKPGTLKGKKELNKPIYCMILTAKWILTPTCNSVNSFFHTGYIVMTIVCSKQLQTAEIAPPCSAISSTTSHCSQL